LKKKVTHKAQMAGIIVAIVTKSRPGTSPKPEGATSKPARA